MPVKSDIYNDYADKYAESYSNRGYSKISDDTLGITQRMFDLLGDVSNLHVLDAGCGEGYLSRILAANGAKVTGIDISSHLIEIARERSQDDTTCFYVDDLSAPSTNFREYFDVIASRLVLNDVQNYQGFISTLASMVKPEGKAVIAMNNPYSYIIRKHVSDYFDSGTAFPYRGMAKEGLKVHFYHRTMEEYIDAFVSNGFQLIKYVDLETFVNNSHAPHMDTLLPQGYRFPYFTLLSFKKAI